MATTTTAPAQPHGPSLADIVPTLELPATPTRALDVGCGAGEDVRWLHEAGFQAVGFDASAAVLEVAASRTPPGMQVEWLEGSATSIPLADASCVLVTDRGCLHHLEPGLRPKYAGEVARLLAPGGAWVIRDVVGHAHQVAELTPEAVADLAGHASLHVESCGVTSAGRSHDWMLAVLRKH